MKPPPFAYHAPTDIYAALELMAESGGDARFLAGGQSLVPMMNFRVAAPSALVDLNGIADLRSVRADADGSLLLGAMTRTRRLETDREIAAAQPLLSHAAGHVAHVQIRNRGTLGGSLAHADPAAELPGVALACDARIRIAGPDGRREIEAKDFFAGVFATAAGEGELIAEIVFPAWPAGRRWGFREISRREGDFALIGIAAWYDLGADGRISDARLAAIGAGDTPLRLVSGEAILRGGIPSADLFGETARASVADLRPGSDLHASADYRREVGGVLVARVLADAMERRP